MVIGYGVSHWVLILGNLLAENGLILPHFTTLSSIVPLITLPVQGPLCAPKAPVTGLNGKEQPGGDLRTLWGLRSAPQPRKRGVPWAGRPGAQDLRRPALIIRAAVFGAFGPGFQRHFESGRFSSPPDLKRPPWWLAARL